MRRTSSRSMLATGGMSRGKAGPLVPLGPTIVGAVSSTLALSSGFVAAEQRLEVTVETFEELVDLEHVVNGDGVARFVGRLGRNLARAADVLFTELAQGELGFLGIA